MYLLNLFIAEEAVRSEVFSKGESDRIQFIKNNRLDMDLVLREFVEYFNEIYGDSDDRFIETYGRKFFLLYLKSIINGTGNYYLEAQTRDARRTDVIVDYLGEQFIIELKIWHGNEYNEGGEAQVARQLWKQMYKRLLTYRTEMKKFIFTSKENEKATDIYYK